MTITGLDVLLKLLKVVVFLFDVITFPIYKLLQQPWKERTKQNHGKVFSNLTVFGVMWISYKTSIKISNLIQFNSPTGCQHP